MLAVHSPCLDDHREYLVVDVNAYRRAKPERWDAVVMNPKERPDGRRSLKCFEWSVCLAKQLRSRDGNVMIDGQALTPPQQLQKIKFHSNLRMSNPLGTHTSSQRTLLFVGRQSGRGQG